MHQTKKGNQYYFGAKAHIGVDSKEGVVHSVCTSAARCMTSICCPTYCMAAKRRSGAMPVIRGKPRRSTRPRRSAGYDLPADQIKAVDEEEKRKNPTKSRVRAKVEWPFRILKRVFGFTKVRYRGIWKNHHWLCAAFALVNLYQHRNRLAPQRA